MTGKEPCIATHYQCDDGASQGTATRILSASSTDFGVASTGMHIAYLPTGGTSIFCCILNFA